jgi:hypothetical protein
MPKLLCEFIVPGGGAWDGEKLHHFFYDQDGKDIPCIRIGKPGFNDFIA